MVLNTNIRGGIDGFKINGKSYDVEATVKVNLGTPLREERVGAVGYLGVSEKSQPAMFELEIVDRGDLDVEELVGTRDATIYIPLKNGKGYSGRNMTAVGDFSIDTETGKISAKFAGPRITEV